MRTVQLYIQLLHKYHNIIIINTFYFVQFFIIIHIYFALLCPIFVHCSKKKLKPILNEFERSYFIYKIICIVILIYRKNLLLFFLYQFNILPLKNKKKHVKC